MFEEIITEAAELLAEKQLGIRRNKDSDKEENLPVMLVQFRDIYERELTEQFNKICATMKMKFDLRDLEPKTMHNIAIGIKDVVEDAVKDGNSVSISGIFQNTAIIKVAEKETARQKEKEAATDIEKTQGTPIILPENKEENKTVEPMTIDIAREFCKKITPTMKKVNDLSVGLTKDNYEERKAEFEKIFNSEEAKSELEKREKALKEVEKNGTPQEQIGATLESNLINNIHELKENKKSSTKLMTSLSDLLDCAYSTDWFKNDVEKISYYFNNYLFISDFGKELIDKKIPPNATIEDVRDIVALNMVKLAEMRGQKLDVDEIKEQAKRKNTERELQLDRSGSNDRDVDTGEIKVTMDYAKKFLDRDEEKRVIDFISQLEQNTEIDFDVLDQISSINKDFYFSIIRNIGLAAEKTKNPLLQQKYQELVEQEVYGQLMRNRKEDMLKLRFSQLRESKETPKRSIISGVLFNFMRAAHHSNESLEIHKKELEYYLERENCLSAEEKQQMIEKLQTVNSLEDFDDLLFNKMEELTNENGKKLDKERTMQAASKMHFPSKLEIARAKAKIIFDEGLFNKYEKFNQDLVNGLKDENDGYDFEVLDMVYHRSPEIYGILMDYMKDICRVRNDDQLKLVYNMRVSSGISDETFDKANQDEKNAIANRIEVAMNSRRDKSKTNSTNKTSASLFNLMIKIYDEKNGSDEVFETLKNEVFDYVANDMALSDEQTAEMLNRIANATRHNELGRALAEKMVELAEERGIPTKNLIPEQIVGQAKARTQTKNIKKEENFDRRSILLSRVYAKMFLNVGDRAKVIGLIEQMSSTTKNVGYDFSILDKVKDTDEAFYYSMIRTIGVLANRTKNDELNEKYNELLANELMEKNYNELDDFGKINAKAKIVFDEGIYNRYKNLENEIINSSPDGVYDEELIKFIKDKEPHIYTTLISQMKKIAKNRNDEGLSSVINKFELGDKKSKDTVLEDDVKSGTSVINAQNLSVDEIVVTHSDGLDMFASKNKNGQTIDDTDEGR